MQNTTSPQPFMPASLRHRSFADLLCTFGGALLAIMGLIGFVAPNFLGMHLSLTHNIAHLALVCVALWMGLTATHRHVTLFSFIMGLAFVALGLLGFIYGQRDASVLYDSGLREYNLTLIPGALSIGKSDHLANIILGSLFVLAGLYADRFNRTERIHAPHRGKTPGI